MEKILAKRLIYMLLFIAVCGLVLRAIHISFKTKTRAIYKQALSQAPFDVIIVPGIPYLNGRPNYMLNVRMHWALTLYNRGLAHNIIFSGGAVHSPYVEGKAMQIIADSLGLPPDHLFCETKAEHSNQNILLGWQLARQLGFKKIALATDAFQAYFLRDFMEKNAPEMMQLPLAPDSTNYYNQPLPVIDASSAKVDNFVPLEKRESWWTRFKHSYLFE